MPTPQLFEFLDIFGEALAVQLDEDAERYGDTWLERSRVGQEERILDRLDEYATAYDRLDQPVPWLKIAGLAMIAWIRENHPDLFPDGT